MQAHVPWPPGRLLSYGDRLHYTPPQMNRGDLERLLSEIRRARIGVVGDFCLDAYLHIDPSLSETSLETGLPTRSVRESRVTPGGAANVVANLRSLGVFRVSAFGVVGDDLFGRELLRQMRALGSDAGGLLTQKAGWHTHVYVKPVEGGREESRLDLGVANELADETRVGLLKAVRTALSRLDLLVINQQRPRGLYTTSFMEELSEMLRRGAPPSVADSRHFSERFEGSMRMICEPEALRIAGTADARAFPREAGSARCVLPPPASGHSWPMAGSAEEAACALERKWGTTVFLTRSARGMLVASGGQTRDIPVIGVNGPTDPVGAGDSALSGIASALAAGRDPFTAAAFGSYVAAVTVKKLFTTGTASPEEILEIFSMSPPSLPS